MRVFNEKKGFAAGARSVRNHSRKKDFTHYRKGVLKGVQSMIYLRGNPTERERNHILLLIFS
jgi:hypothetical protein